LALSLFALACPLLVQCETVITLRDALDRARKYGLQLDPAALAVAQAKEDRVQAKAATLPSLSALNQFIYTEGNGTPSGVFVANDGVHVYNEQAVVHQDVLSFVRRGEIRRAEAAEAAAKAKLDVAARGLNATVIQDDCFSPKKTGQCAEESFGNRKFSRYHAKPGAWRRSSAC
jgi:hypothetical protein